MPSDYDTLVQVSMLLKAIKDNFADRANACLDSITSRKVQDVLEDSIEAALIQRALK